MSERGWVWLGLLGASFLFWAGFIKFLMWWFLG